MFERCRGADNRPHEIDALLQSFLGCLQPFIQGFVRRDTLCKNWEGR
jgi:hypothetical protein